MRLRINQSDSEPTFADKSLANCVKRALLTVARVVMISAPQFTSVLQESKAGVAILATYYCLVFLFVFSKNTYIVSPTLVASSVHNQQSKDLQMCTTFR